MDSFHELIDLSEHRHTLRLLPPEKTSLRGVAILLCAAIFLVYSLSL